MRHWSRKVENLRNKAPPICNHARFILVDVMLTPKSCLGNRALALPRFEVGLFSLVLQLDVQVCAQSVQKCFMRSLQVLFVTLHSFKLIAFMCPILAQQIPRQSQRKPRQSQRKRFTSRCGGVPAAPTPAVTYKNWASTSATTNSLTSVISAAWPSGGPFTCDSTDGATCPKCSCSTVTSALPPAEASWRCWHTCRCMRAKRPSDVGSAMQPSPTGTCCQRTSSPTLESSRTIVSAALVVFPPQRHWPTTLNTAASAQRRLEFGRLFVTEAWIPLLPCA